MKDNVYKPNKKNKDDGSRRFIGIDQPFDCEKVVAVTGQEYVQNLNRDGVAYVPYEELKRTIPGYYLSEDKCIWISIWP